jgi:CxxC motif-containing protein (DUF1111 family)
MKSLRILVLAIFPLLLVMQITSNVKSQSGASEAPAGFDNLTNGLVDQATFDADRDVFEERETIADGLGPVYNAQACAECHQNPNTGATSQITELRAGHFTGSVFVEHPGGSLINDRAINAKAQEVVLDGNEVRAFRSSLNLLGDGFVEEIDDNAIRAVADFQRTVTFGLIAGQVVNSPVLEASNSLRVGRFGWKNQHSSLKSFSADAYLNEMGITSPLQPVENTSNGRSIASFDTVADPEDDGEDIDIFTRFMRASKVPPRDTQLAATADAQAGSQIFDQIGCAICHVRTFVTLPTGTFINGGTFQVPSALGNKTIHPFSDFLLHNIGTGDGIVQNGDQTTRNKMRTAPLWGVRTHNRLMHDGQSFTFNDAIQRHFGEATTVTARYLLLSTTQKNQLITFLRSL